MRSMLILSAILLFTQMSFAQDLALDWKPEPEFGGFYEALNAKIYEKAGLKVNILPGGAGQPVTQMVAAKKVKFGTAAADEVILARANGAKVVALYAVYQNDPQGFMVHPKRNFKSLKDMFQSSGIVALQKGLPYTLWLEKKYSPLKAKIVPYSGGIQSFIQNPEFSQQCFITSEPLAAKKAKVDAQTFLVSESGFNPYLTVVIAHEDTLKSEPEVVKSFIDSTRKGWAAYLASPQKTNAMMQKLNPTMDLETFNEISNVQKPFIETAETRKNGLGTMTKTRWETLYHQLIELKLAKAGTDVSSFFK